MVQRGMCDKIERFRKRNTPRVALDVFASQALIAALDSAGIRVVYVAPHATQDHIWVKEAIKRRANVFVSPDMDILGFAGDADCKSITVPQDMLAGPKDQLNEWVIKYIDVLFPHRNKTDSEIYDMVS